MTVGEVIALICKYASNDDIYLMAKDVYSIDIDDEKIYLHFTDANTSNYSIMAKESEQNEDNY